MEETLKSIISLTSLTWETKISILNMINDKYTDTFHEIIVETSQISNSY